MSQSPIKRIAYLRVTQESNAMSPVLTEVSDFEAAHYMEGATLHAATEPRGVEVAGFTKNAELSGFRRAVDKFGEGKVEAVPLLSAWAISGGPLSETCFTHFLDGVRASLELSLIHI